MVCPYLPLLDDVKAVAHEAGRAIMAVYSRHDYRVKQKADASPVTEADIAAHHVITKGLSALTPDWPVLSEEGALPPFTERQQWQRYWLVDPLDGTREFIKCNGEFTVNIALIEQGVAVMGVIQVPVSEACYFALKAHGAYKDAPGEQAKKISSRAWDGKHITIAGSRSNRVPVFNAFLEYFNRYELLALGSSLKSCYVAEGKADIYARFGPTAEWDTAAAQCIVEEAGGALTDMALAPLRYNRKASILNPPFFAFGDGCHDWRRFVPR